MNRSQKEQAIAELKSGLEAAQSVVVASHMGMDVNTVNELRAEFRKKGVRYHIVKNTLAKLAIQGTEFEDMAPLLSGPTALAYSSEEAPAPAKVIKEFAKDHDKFVVKGGFLPGSGLLDEAGVKALAEMLTQDELRAKLLGTFKAVPTKLVSTFAAAPRKFVNVLNARKADLEAA